MTLPHYIAAHWSRANRAVQDVADLLDADGSPALASDVRALGDALRNLELLAPLRVTRTRKDLRPVV